MRLAAPLAATLALAACGEPADNAVQRIALGESRAGPTVVGSPDTAGAQWAVRDGGSEIIFAKAGEPPFLTIRCEAGETARPGLRIVRHAPADPGAKALFALIGNGRVARIEIDARREGESWRWEAALPAADERLAVLDGGGAVEATLPGAGTINLAGSALPGELLARCRESAEPVR